MKILANAFAFASYLSSIPLRIPSHLRTPTHTRHPRSRLPTHTHPHARSSYRSSTRAHNRHYQDSRCGLQGSTSFQKSSVKLHAASDLCAKIYVTSMAARLHPRVSRNCSPSPLVRARLSEGRMMTRPRDPRGHAVRAANASGCVENVARVAISMSGVLVVVPGKEYLLGRPVVKGREQGSAVWREEKDLKRLLGT